jgi:hypothetical protein
VTPAELTMATTGSQIRLEPRISLAGRASRGGLAYWPGGLAGGMFWLTWNVLSGS